MATLTELKLSYLQGTKDAIKNALIEKGQGVADEDTFRSYADKILAMEAGSGDGVDPYYQQLAEAVVTRDAEHLSGDETVLSMKGFKTSSGATLGTLAEYSFAGFGNVEGMAFTDVVMISANAFEGDAKLKILDFTVSEVFPQIAMYPNALSGCSALEAVIVRDGANGLTSVSIPTDNGANDTFYVYVPSAYYDTVIASLVSTSISSDRFRKLEDYPEIANWNETYTVNFYDGDTLVDTKTVKCGQSATSSYSKEGYVFVEWSPAPTNVTSNMDCYGSWVRTFATASWEEIRSVTDAGTSSSVYKVGDTKTDVLTYSDGTTEEIEWVIAKIRDNGTMVLALNYALATLKPMHSSSSAYAYYFNNDLGSHITNTIVPALSPDLSAVIRQASDGLLNRTLRLPTNYNVLGTSTNTSAQYENLPLFSTQSKRIRTRKADGVAVTYWLNAYTKSGSYYYFSHVDTTGAVVAGNSGATGITNERGVVLLCDV